MDKPFDVQNLEARLKSKGIAQVEGLAEIVVTELFGWLEESLNAEPNPLFKIGIPVLEVLKPMALSEVKKISPST